MSLLPSPSYSFQNPRQILSLSTAPGSTSSAYILSINALPDPSKLLLSHGTSTLSIADKETFKIVDTWTCPEGQGEVVDVAVDWDGSGRVWTCGKEGAVRCWDSRVFGGVGMEIGKGGKGLRAPGGRPTPLLSVASAPQHHLLAAGTELTSHEASILYWDIRNAAQPSHINTSLHSDDITSLSFAPSHLHSTPFPIDPNASPSDSKHQPAHTSAVLLSSSTDGLIALSDGLEQDEDESVLTMGNGNVSVAKAGWTGGSSFGGWGVWGRDDMDGVSWWDARDFTLECTVPSLRVATEPSTSPSWETDYLVEVLPNLPVSSTGHVRGCLLGNNSGDTSLLSSNSTSPTPDVLSLDQTFKSGFKGHRDVVRSAFYDENSRTLYTGSEDSVLCAWPIEAVASTTEDVEMDTDAPSTGEAAQPMEESRMDEDEELGGGGGKRKHEGETEEERAARKARKREKKEKKERKRMEAEGN